MGQTIAKRGLSRLGIPTMSFTRRHLPHWIPEGADIFATWRLAGCLPPCVAVRPNRLQCGPEWLRDARIASVVANALLYGETHRRFYQLFAWVIMPNHVHVIFQPRVATPTIMRWLKGRTGRVANQLLGRTGKPFWQDESFDHWVRSAQELRELIEYVENNPVKAALVPAKEQWRWSSAGWVTNYASSTDESSLIAEASLTDDASDRLSHF